MTENHVLFNDLPLNSPYVSRPSNESLSQRQVGDFPHIVALSVGCYGRTKKHVQASLVHALAQRCTNVLKSFFVPCDL